MKKPRRYYRLLNLGVFPYDVLVCQGMTTEELKEYLEKKYNLRLLSEEESAFEHHDTRQGKTMHLSTNQTILWLKWPPTTPSAIATLAHEALHAIGFIYDTMGIPFRQENDETIAYGVEYLVEEVLKDFRK